MAGILERLFGPKPPVRDYHAGPELAGLDPVTARAIGLQRDYWRAAPDELSELESQGFEALSWPDKLRVHHLRCLALLDANGGALRRALLAPAAERPLELAPAPDPLGPLRASARALLSRRSPFRPRHAFCWLGSGAPEAEAIPYSNFQGRTLNASLSHLGSIELITLDDALEPARLEFLALDEIMTLARAQLDDPEHAPPFVPVRVLREYGADEIVALLPTRYGLGWLSHEPAVLRAQPGPESEHAVAPVELAGLADPARAAGNVHDRRPLQLAIGRQQLEVLSDYAQAGLGRFALGAAYQISFAIDQDDPRFVAKCEGRGLDPAATRGDVVRESRLRASARAAARGEGRSD